MGNDEGDRAQFPRRAFLHAVGLGAVGLAAAGRVAAGPGAAARALGSGQLREIRLEAREAMWELAPGKRIAAMTYNGQVPGPEIRMKEGERVRILFKNGLAEPTTVHWHGVDVPNPMDGVAGVTQSALGPGEIFAYEFDAHPAGSRWYHTHTEEHRQLDLGLAGALIIEPAAPEPVTFDREITLVLDDWSTGVGQPLPPARQGLGEPRGMGRMMGGGPMDRAMMGHGPMGHGSGGAHAHPYDTLTINGKAYPATTPLILRRDERVRLRLINASSEHTHVLRLAGHRLTVTHTDGNALARPVEVDAVPIAPSERYDVLVVTDRPGAWFLYCTEPRHAAAGEQLLVATAGSEAQRPDPPVEGTAGLHLWQYDLGRGQDILPRASGRERAFALDLAGGMMGADLWTINGRQFPEIDPLRVERGDRVRVRFVNHSMEAHPMHLHGQSFRVLAVNGRTLPAPLVKDSVDVAPFMGAVDIEFTALNPGDWLLHCHKPMHMEGGMATLVKIA